MYFVVDADPQVGYDQAKNDDMPDQVRIAKQNNPDIIKRLQRNYDIKFLIVCGDLTENGSDGQSQCMPCCVPNKYGDQLDIFLDTYYNPIRQRVPIYLCPGNHDNDVKWPYVRKPVMKYISDQHGGLNYFFDRDTNSSVYEESETYIIRFVCCGIYPDKKCLEWLEKDVLNGSVDSYIFFFHYPVKGLWADWWTDDEKDAFYQTIKKVKTIAILTGHHHKNRGGSWHNIPFIVAGGKGLALCNVENNEVSFDFIKN